MALVQTLDLELVPGQHVFVALFDGVTPASATRVLEHYLPRAPAAETKGGAEVAAAAAAGSKRKADDADKAVATEPTPAAAGPAALPVALVDAELVFSKYHFAVAATNAAHRAAVGAGVPGRGRGLRTRSVHSELLLCLAAGRSIDGALKTLGLKAASTRVALASFESAAVVAEAAALLLVSGEAAEAEALPPVSWSWEALEASAWERRAVFVKHFKLSKEETARAVNKAELEAAVVSRVGIQGHEKDN